MIRGDYECEACGKVETFTFDGELPSVVDHFCTKLRETTRWSRKWTAPHTGAGSSGEPPR